MPNNFFTKDKNATNKARIATILTAILVLLGLYFITFSKIDPKAIAQRERLKKKETGVVVNFGTSNQGKGNVQKQAVAKSSDKAQKQSSAKKAPVKQPTKAVKKPTPKKTTPKKSTPKKVVPKKTSTKKAVSKKTNTKKATAKKVTKPTPKPVAKKPVVQQKTETKVIPTTPQPVSKPVAKPVEPTPKPVSKPQPAPAAAPAPTPVSQPSTQPATTSTPTSSNPVSSSTASSSSTTSTSQPNNSQSTIDEGGTSNTPARQTINNRSLYPGKKNVESSGEGNTNTAGDQGSSTGSEKKGRYQGTSVGTGNSGINHSLIGRKLIKEPSITDNSNLEGKITVKIKVDQNGNVIGSSLGYPTTISNNTLIQKALRAAKETKFNANRQAAEEQFGTMTFIFKVK